jgi:hypothetical protein
LSGRFLPRAFCKVLDLPKPWNKPRRPPTFKLQSLTYLQSKPCAHKCNVFVCATALAHTLMISLTACVKVAFHFSISKFICTLADFAKLPCNARRVASLPRASRRAWFFHHAHVSAPHSGGSTPSAPICLRGPCGYQHPLRKNDGL